MQIALISILRLLCFCRSPPLWSARGLQTVARGAQAEQSLVSLWLLSIVHILLSNLQVFPLSICCGQRDDAMRTQYVCGCNERRLYSSESRPRACSQATETGDERDSVNTGLSVVTSALFLGCPLR